MCKITTRNRGAQPLTVRLLVTGTSTRTAKLLGLAAARVSDQERAVVSEEDVLDLPLARLIDDYGPNKGSEM